MDFGEALLDAAHHVLVPLELQVSMKPALHQDPGTAQFLRFANFFVDRLKIQHISLGAAGALDGCIKSAKGAVLGAEICVINVAVDDVGNHALGMQLAPKSIGFHPNANQVIGTKQVECLLFCKGHEPIYFTEFLRSKTLPNLWQVLPFPPLRRRRPMESTAPDPLNCPA